MTSSRVLLPQKIDPNALTKNACPADLTILDELIAFTRASSEIKEQIKNNVLKVIDCFRFIKTNKEFILYAVAHPEDMCIYVYTIDYGHRLLRDINNTAFHFASYPPEQAHQFWERIEALTLQIENAYQEMKQRNQHLDFVKAFRWDNEGGCLEARVSGALNYAARQISQPETRIEDVIEEAYQQNNWGDELSISIQAKYRDIFQRCLEKDLFGHYVYLGKRDHAKILLTRAMLARYVHPYFRDILSEEDETVAIDIHLPVHPFTAFSAIKLINNHQALVKVIASPNNDNQHWDFLFRQLEAPKKERPIIVHTTHKKEVFNPLTQKMEKRSASVKRGQLKLTPYIKKTALTLLPPDGKMTLFGQGIDNAGVVWDLTYCDVKNEKYTFPENANTVLLKSQLWRNAPQSITIEGIRQQNDRAREIGRVLEHNEILAAPSLQGLRAIFATANHCEARINALRIKLYINDTYQINLPLLIQNSNQKIMAYTFPQQIADIIHLKNQPNNAITNPDSQAYKLLNQFYHFYSKENLNAKERGVTLLTYLEFVLLHAESKHKKELLSHIEEEITKFNTHHAGDKSLLHFSAEEGFLTASRFLLEKDKTTLLQQDILGNTPLHYACQSNLTLARYFIKQGARLNTPLNNMHESPHYLLHVFNKKKHDERMQKFEHKRSSFACLLLGSLGGIFFIASFFGVILMISVLSPMLMVIPLTIIPILFVFVFVMSLPYLSKWHNFITKQLSNAAKILSTCINALELKFFLFKVGLDRIVTWNEKITQLATSVSCPAWMQTVSKSFLQGFFAGTLMGFFLGAMFGGLSGAAFATVPGMIIGASLFGAIGCAVGGLAGGVIGILKGTYLHFIKKQSTPAANSNLIKNTLSVNEKTQKEIKKNVPAPMITTKIHNESIIYRNSQRFFNRSSKPVEVASSIYMENTFKATARH